VLDSLDTAAVRRWAAVGLDALRRHQNEINELNVYPVPDSDTGTNLVLTLSCAWEAVAGPSESEIAGPGRVLARMAQAALVGARGNSGAILAQILRGAAEALGSVAATRGRGLAGALTAAAQAAYAAVAEPAQGTVLSVAAGAAAAAADADSDDLGTVTRAAARGASEALARTPQQLPVLARAGVVDAGGLGLAVLLDSLVEVVTGAPPDSPAAAQGVAAAAVRASTIALTRETGSAQYGYEVQYLLDATEEAVQQLRPRLTALGDSLVIVGSAVATDPPLWHIHVHVNDAGAAIEAGVAAGRPHRISVTRFDDEAPPAAPAPGVRGLVVVAPGSGLGALFASEGAVVVSADAPSAQDLLAAVRATGASRVVMLPNDVDVLPAAQAAAEQARASGVRVGVVPTRSPVQAMAAIAVRDSGRHFHDDMIAMAEAAGACRYAEVSVAANQALTVAGRCEPGDILGLVEGDVNVIGRDLYQTCATLLDRMLGGGGELVTLVVGADAPNGFGDALIAHVGHAWPFAEVRVYQGGQPDHPLLVGVE
jgi:DAK2 domain fusion protein YloV